MKGSNGLQRGSGCPCRLSPWMTPAGEGWPTTCWSNRNRLTKRPHGEMVFWRVRCVCVRIGYSILTWRRLGKGRNHHSGWRVVGVVSQGYFLFEAAECGGGGKTCPQDQGGRSDGVGQAGGRQPQVRGAGYQALPEQRAPTRGPDKCRQYGFDECGGAF